MTRRESCFLGLGASLTWAGLDLVRGEWLAVVMLLAALFFWLDIRDSGSDPQGEDPKGLSASASQSGPTGHRPNPTPITTPTGTREP